MNQLVMRKNAILISLSEVVDHEVVQHRIIRHNRKHLPTLLIHPLQTLITLPEPLTKHHTPLMQEPRPTVMTRLLLLILVNIRPTLRTPRNKVIVV